MLYYWKKNCPYNYVINNDGKLIEFVPFELFTLKEIEKMKISTTSLKFHFYKIGLPKNNTFKAFGCRFPDEEMSKFLAKEYDIQF